MPYTVLSLYVCSSRLAIYQSIIADGRRTDGWMDEWADGRGDEALLFCLTGGRPTY